ncbi:reverse transcriptase domain-containing protein [Tanacetum coccineum]
MAERTMEELLRAPTEGYGEAIVLPEINADHFEIKTNLLQLVQANPFYGRENDNPHAHINSFKRITSTLRFRNVPNDVIKLMMFPYSLEGAAKTWYEKEPPNSILTWEDLVTKFVNQFFPPSKTTHLKNEISRFTQKFEETFSEAWERFKELLRACPHHGFTELTQVDTFYNGLNDNEQDSLNAAAGGNLLSKTTREALNIIENKSKVRYSRNKPNASRMNVTSSKTDERIDKLADQLSTLVEIVSKKVVTPAPLYKPFLGYDHIPPNKKCMALLLAEERFLKIKQAMEEEQNQPEVLQELLLKLMNDLQILKGIQQEKKETTAQIIFPISLPRSNFLSEEFAGELAPILPDIHEADFDEEEDICDDDTSSDNDNFEDIEYVDATPSNSELVSLEEVEDVILRDKLSNVYLLISKIEALNDNPTLSSISNSGLISIDISNEPLLELLELESFHFDLYDDPLFPRPPPEPPDVEISLISEPSKPVKNDFDELNDDDYFDPGGGEIVVSQNVEDDDSFTFVIWTFIPYLTYPEVSPLLSSTKNEDTLLTPGISLRAVALSGMELSYNAGFGFWQRLGINHEKLQFFTLRVCQFFFFLLLVCIDEAACNLRLKSSDKESDINPNALLPLLSVVSDFVFFAGLDLPAGRGLTSGPNISVRSFVSRGFGASHLE